MDRILSRTAIHRHSFFRSWPSIPSSFSLSFNRLRSSKPQYIEIELDPSSDGVRDVERIASRKIEEMIHRIVVLKSTPDWLPFIPGSSFWVPPQIRPLSIGDLLGKLTNQLTDEESLSLTTVRGWPSSTFFVEETGSNRLAKIDVEVKVPEEEGLGVEVKVETLSDSEVKSQPKDEEG
ncbi:hypothetical protein CFOL_v3_24927 [Cephalotus follicularis]|uniref:Uncharacterized protein n=1 Tax=Cephalotus follicularis TaxID=3775 RepID=A0A1Q3CMY2_CEPFO|nr:hypothetical protein CFOL_v3_24927 [Cephalotus follicularis]